MDTLDTAEKIVANAKAKYPEHRFAVSASGGAIGMWCESIGRFYMVAAKVIIPHPEDGGEWWVDVERELLINGQPPVNDWVAV